jgi:hypothetical protein
MSKTQIAFLLVALVALVAIVIQYRASAAPEALSPEAQRPPGMPTTGGVQRPEDVAAVARDGARAVMSRKAKLVAACWTPLVSNQAEPAHSRHVLRETFDADGKETARTVDDVPGESRADVAACLRGLPLDLEIAAAGRPTTISVTLVFP